MANADPSLVLKVWGPPPPATLGSTGSLWPGRGGTPRRTSRERGISGGSTCLQPFAAEGSCRERRVGPSPTARTLAAFLLLTTDPAWSHSAGVCVSLPAPPRPSTRLASLTARFAHGLAPLTLRSEEHTSELQSPCNLVCRLLLEKKNNPSLQLRLHLH